MFLYLQKAFFFIVSIVMVEPYTIILSHMTKKVGDILAHSNLVDLFLTHELYQDISILFHSRFVLYSHIALNVLEGLCFIS